MNIKSFLSEDQKEAVHAAIREAELQTSGEIRVHLENRCKEEVLDRAVFIFRRLDMQATEGKNGVLFYIAVKDRKFSILGDVGINGKVPDHFWNQIKDEMTEYFKREQFAEGIVSAVKVAGEQLKLYFPHQANDKNELSDDISYGGEED
ncbi:MAG: TPM domain-containing protein [Verrucomicrobiales bacterium]|nr:TPM domain-containing protein [Verrucomicrobiales bacterium]